MCENKTTPKCNRTCTSTTVAPLYSSYSISLSALEVKQKIVQQADKWRTPPHSTTFCRSLHSRAESPAIKRKQAQNLRGFQANLFKTSSSFTLPPKHWVRTRRGLPAAFISTQIDGRSPAPSRRPGSEPCHQPQAGKRSVQAASSYALSMLTCTT